MCHCNRLRRIGIIFSKTTQNRHKNCGFVHFIPKNFLLSHFVELIKLRV